MKAGAIAIRSTAQDTAGPPRRRHSPKVRRGNPLSLAAHQLCVPLVISTVPRRAKMSLPDHLHEDLPVYTALFRAGVLPLLPRQAREERETYLQRCAEQLSKDTRLELTLQTADRLPLWDGSQHLNARDLVWSVELPMFRQIGTLVQDFRANVRVAFPHKNAGEHVLVHLERATRHLFPVFGLAAAQQAWNDSYGHGDEGEWWREVRREAAQALNIDPKELTNRQLKRSVRQRGLFTPTAFKRRVGQGYAGAWQRPMPLDDLLALSAQAYGDWKEPWARLIHDLTGLYQLDAACRALWEDDTYEIIQLSSEHIFPIRFGFLIEVDMIEENDEWTGLFSELHSELFSDGEETPANFSMHLTAQNVLRMQRALDALQRGAALTEKIIEQIANQFT